MVGASTTALLFIAADWPRSDRERVLIILHDDVVDLLCFFVGDDHEPLRPGRTGITLSLIHLPALAAGLTAALSEARRHGLIDG